MCGIIAIVSRRPARAAPEPTELIGGLDQALALVGDPLAVAAAAAEVDTARHMGSPAYSPSPIGTS